MTENTNKKPASFRCFRISCRKLNSNGLQSMKEILDALYLIPDFDKKNLVQKEKNKTLTTFKIQKKLTDSLFTFHFFKINGDPNQIILDLKSGNSSKIVDEISGIGSEKGFLSLTTCAYDFQNDIFFWHSVKSPTIDDFRFFIESTCNTKLTFRPVKDPNAENFFQIMSPDKFEVEVSIPSIDNAISLASNLSPESKIGAYRQLMNSSGAGFLSVVLSADSRKGEKSLNQNFIKDEVSFLKSFISMLPGKRKKMIVTGTVSENGNLERKMIDLIDNLMLFPWELGEFSDLGKLLEYKEDSSVEVINQFRDSYSTN
jgi:hypothetical protein